MPNQPISLSEARKAGRIAQFVSQHEGETGDLNAFNLTLHSMAGKSRATQEASPPDDCDD